MVNGKQKESEYEFLKLLLERYMVTLEYNHPAMVEDPEMKDDPRWIKKRAELIEEALREAKEQSDK